MEILDFGCGPGRRVYELLDAGYQHAYGVDVVDYLELWRPEDHHRFHIAPDGDIPLPEASLDLVISDQCFEHVMNQPLAWQEIVRILKPGGVSVHVIPAKWQIIEPHIKVPLGGSRYSNATVLFLWAILGVRNEFQHSSSACRVAPRNFEYANK